MKIIGKIINGKLGLSDYNRKVYHDFLANPKNAGRAIAIQDRVPESREQRRFYHGACLVLWAYLNGWDYRDGDTIGFLHETAKKEFNGEIVLLDGKEVRRGKSSKGLLSENDEQNSGYLERIISHLEEQYGIDRTKVLNPTHYKDFRDRIYMNGKYDTYIDYLIALNFLKPYEKDTNNAK